MLPVVVANTLVLACSVLDRAATHNSLSTWASAGDISFAAPLPAAFAPNHGIFDSGPFSTKMHAVVGAAKMVRGAANELKSTIMGPAYSAAAVGEHA